MIKLEAILPGVPRAAREAVNARDRRLGEMIIFHQSELRPRERLHDFRGARPLNRQQTIVGTPIRNRHLERRGLLPNPGKILVDVAGIDAEEVVVRRAEVHQQIVDDPAVRVTHRGVEHPAGIKFGHIVRHEVIQKPTRFRSADIDLPHVAHVEQARGSPDRFVLLQDAAILHRHLPAREVDQPRAVGCMEIPERRALEFTHARSIAGRRRGAARLISLPPPIRRFANGTTSPLNFA